MAIMRMLMRSMMLMIVAVLMMTIICRRSYDADNSDGGDECDNYDGGNCNDNAKLL